MIKRPHPREDDDELLRQQQEFFQNIAQNRFNPAVVVHKARQENVSASSLVNNVSGINGINSKDTSLSSFDIQEQIANTFESIPTNVTLNKISEKQLKVSTISSLKFDCAGFPKAVRRGPDIKPSKGSIFSQHIKRIKNEEMNRDVLEDNKMEVDNLSLVVKERNVDSNIIDKISSTSREKHKIKKNTSILSQTDYEQIHHENIKKIKMMSEEEIKAERDKLVLSMDPAIVKYLQSRKKEEIVQTRNVTIQEQNRVSSSIILEELETPADVLAQPQAESWINFNTIETNKLAWMKNIDIPKIPKDQPFEARFDFYGYLLPYSQEVIDDKNRILYHHGEEPGRPGYSMQELLQLCRSNIIQQKVVALNTLANILGLYSTGIYENVFEIPIEQIFFVLRFCLDDNTPAVLNACIKAIRNLIYFQLDEACLDNMINFGIGVIQPILAIDEDLEDDSTVNDQQLVEKNLIKCLIRTNIYVRIRYIINSLRPSLETIMYSLEILIRLGRDSQYAVNKMFACDGLLSSLIRKFLPHPSQIKFDKSPSNNIPLVHMIKFIRVLSARKKSVADALLKRYQLLEIILGYLYEELFSVNANGMKLQIECMHYLFLLLHYDLSNELLCPNEILLKYAAYHFYNTDNLNTTTLIRQSHVAALCLVIGKLIQKKQTISNELHKMIDLCIEKWITQFQYIQNFSCGQSQIISASLYVASAYNEHFVSEKIDILIENLIKSVQFSEVTKDIKNCSMILNNFDTHQPSANLKSLQAAAWFTMDHIIPLMQGNSCIPFLYNLTRYIAATKSYELKLRFLTHPNINEYLKALECSNHYFNTGNWFTRCESGLIMIILKIAKSVQRQLNPSIFYHIAVKCLCIFGIEHKSEIKDLLDSIIFSLDFFPLEAVLENTKIDEEPADFKIFLGDIKRVYMQTFGIERIIQASDSFSFDVSIANIIPVDWIYAPIMSSKEEINKNNVSMEQSDVVLSCLRWILIYETHFPFLAASISPTEKFCRLASLFLANDNLFLLPDVEHLMQQNFKHLLKYEKEFNFRQEISGLNNFEDFYTQLLEQYQSLSYGSKLFGNVILIPLCQRHNVQYRKTLWSEYFGVVEIFNVMPSEAWIDLTQFITPPEKDVSLLMCYRRALYHRYIKYKSVLYCIAAHHKNIASKVCQY